MFKLFRRWGHKPAPPPAYQTGTDAQALAVRPIPGALTTRDLPTNHVGLPGRAKLEARRGK